MYQNNTGNNSLCHFNILFLSSFQLEIMTNIAGETSIGTILREFQVRKSTAVI